MTVKVIHCTCKSTFQDKVYGLGMRVMNATKKLGLIQYYRCTVCSTVK